MSKAEFYTACGTRSLRGTHRRAGMYRYQEKNAYDANPVSWRVESTSDSLRCVMGRLMITTVLFSTSVTLYVLVETHWTRTALKACCSRVKRAMAAANNPNAFAFLSRIKTLWLYTYLFVNLIRVHHTSFLKSQQHSCISVSYQNERNLLHPLTRSFFANQ